MCTTAPDIAAHHARAVGHRQDLGAAGTIGAQVRGRKPSGAEGERGTAVGSERHEGEPRIRKTTIRVANDDLTTRQHGDPADHTFKLRRDRENDNAALAERRIRGAVGVESNDKTTDGAVGSRRPTSLAVRLKRTAGHGVAGGRDRRKAIGAVRSVWRSVRHELINFNVRGCLSKTDTP